MKMLVSSFLCSVLVFGCGGGSEDEPVSAPPKAAPSTVPPSGGSGGSGGDGALTGKVTFTGDAPASEPIQMGADPTCARVHPDAPHTEFVVVGDDGGLKNVFVYIKEGLEGQSFEMPSEAATLDQIGCLYTPRVFGMRTGQKLTISNGDDTLHNIHAMPSNNKEFNIGQPIKGLKTDKVFDQSEVMVPFKCDVHKWMAAYVGVVDHPFFATTDTSGSYSIQGLPAGDYVVEAWHETYGTQQMQVSVGADGADASFTYSP